VSKKRQKGHFSVVFGPFGGPKLPKLLKISRVNVLIILNIKISTYSSLDSPRKSAMPLLGKFSAL